MPCFLTCLKKQGLEVFRLLQAARASVARSTAIAVNGHDHPSWMLVVAVAALASAVFETGSFKTSDQLVDFSQHRVNVIPCGIMSVLALLPFPMKIDKTRPRVF